MIINKEVNIVHQQKLFPLNPDKRLFGWKCNAKHRFHATLRVLTLAGLVEVKKERRINTAIPPHDVRRFISLPMSMIKNTNIATATAK